MRGRLLGLDDARLAHAVSRLLDAAYARTGDITAEGCRYDHAATEALVMMADALGDYGLDPEACLGFIEWAAEALGAVPVGAPPQAFQRALRERLDGLRALG